MATTKQTKTADKVSTSLTNNGDMSATLAKKDAAQAKYENASYSPSAETQAYKKAMDDMGEYDSPYSEPINNIFSNLQKGYDMNNDPTFKQYQDIYTRNAQEASRDVVARQAALNGGAASSMAQRQASQSYNNTMQGLYDLVPQLSQQWTSNQQALLSAYQNQDQLDYTKFTDNRTFYQNMYLAAQDRDMDLYNTELQKMYNTIAMYQTDIDTAMSYKEWATEFNRQVEQDGISNAIAWAQQELEEAKFKEGQRQFNANLAEEKRQYDTTTAEKKRQNEFNNNVSLAELAIKAAGLSSDEITPATQEEMGEYKIYLDNLWEKSDNNIQSQNGAISAMADYIAKLSERGRLTDEQVSQLDYYAKKLQNS